MKSMSITPRKGIAIVPALFVVVALAALGAALVNLSTTQHVTHAYDYLGSQALAAARAGTEWAVGSIRAGGGCSSATFGGGPLFPQFTLEVICLAEGPMDDEGKNITVYRVTSTAKTTGSAPGSLGYVERQVFAAVAIES